MWKDVMKSSVISWYEKEYGGVIDPAYPNEYGQKLRALGLEPNLVILGWWYKPGDAFGVPLLWFEAVIDLETKGYANGYPPPTGVNNA